MDLALIYLLARVKGAVLRVSYLPAATCLNYFQTPAAVILRKFLSTVKGFEHRTIRFVIQQILKRAALTAASYRIGNWADFRGAYCLYLVVSEGHLSA